jgi:putative transposase
MVSHGAVGKSWYVDETYIKVQGQWCYLYRAVDRHGHLIDARLSDTRDLAAAEAFFRSAWTVAGVAPDRITTDGHDAYPRAIRQVFGNRVVHRTNRYLNNHLEQDHRGIKNGIVPWAGSSKGTPPPAFAAPLMKSVPFCARSHSAINRSHSCSAGTSIATGLVS